jgi:zinc transporter ZupT
LLSLLAAYEHVCTGSGVKERILGKTPSKLSTHSASAAERANLPPVVPFTFLGTLLLALVHLFGERMTFLSAIPRSRWLSAAGGVSVAYVFLHLLPELREHQTNINDLGLLRFLEHHVYIAALSGLVVFYGLERVVREDEQRGRRKGSHQPGVFWLHIGSFSLYNGIIGYLLVHRETEGYRGLIIFLVALALHFIVNDHGLRQEHREAYRHLARWILASAVIGGWAVGVSTSINAAALAILFAFLAGGIVLNVLKEELPEERRSRFGAFLAGAVAYGALLLLV